MTPARMEATMARWTAALTGLVAAASIATARQHDTYVEDVMVRALGGYTLTHFQFTTDHDPVGASAERHYDLFPKTLALALDTHGVSELHLSMTQGRWRADDWGPPVISAPTGLELWAWMEKPHGPEADVDWKGLTHTLSGLFCGSVHFLGASLSSSPTYAFGPTGAVPLNVTGNGIRGSVRHGILPREESCTENLTPWLKLLPCKGRAGLSSLVDPHVVLAGTYHQIGIHIRRICPDRDCTKMKVQLSQTLTVVHRQNYASARPSLADILPNRIQEIKELCALANRSRVLVDVTRDLSGHAEAYDGTGDNVVQGRGGRLYRVHDALLPVKLTSIGVGTVPLPMRKIAAMRQLNGYGQERGSLVMHITNRQDVMVQVSFMQEIPWFVRIFFSSLKLETSSTIGLPTTAEARIIQRKYVPAVDRQRMATLEIVLNIPADAEVSITVRFEQGWLRLSEHPPDANRGFDIGGAVVSVIDDARDATGGLDWLDQDSDDQYVETRVYTDAALVNLPIPDFSMPYNVITFTCTALFMAWGQIVNYVQQSLTYVKTSDLSKHKSPLHVLIHSVLAKLRLRVPQ